MPQPLIIKALPDIPDLLALHANNPQRYPHLLSSNKAAICGDDDNDIARFDILFACPQQTITAGEGDFPKQLDEAWEAEKQTSISSDLPFTGGWFLYLGYELAEQIETGLNLPLAEDGLPVAFASRFPAAVIIDSHKKLAFLVCEAAFSECAQDIESDLQAAVSSSIYRQAFEIDEIQEDAETAYLQQHEKLHQYIVDGDVFQVNLSRRWRTQLTSTVNHASLYHQLSQSNPGPFNALATLGSRAIISSSPERLIQVKDGTIQTRPIAGTRPRAVDKVADEGLSTELLAHPKERAEHIMLIDLERNDLGRVCEPGSIQVNELMVLESYQHVHHIVSNVRGVVRKNMTPGQLIAAVFPGGTITGCPKVRCMEIMAELEHSPR